MKTKTITSLKKEVLVIELPEGRLLMDFNSLNKLESNGFRKLGFINKITEDDVMDLVNIEPQWEENETFRVIGNATFSALKPFYSAIEKEIYWENPLNDVTCNLLDMTLRQWEKKKKFLEAQQKTFDKSRTLIFIKN